MARKYHVLMVRQDGHWNGPEFGDYDKSVVKDELQDHRDHGVKAKDLHILTVDGDTQAEITEAIAEFRQTQSVAV